MAGSQDTRDLKIVETTWDDRIDLRKASSTDITNYTASKVNFYGKQNVSDSNLWELFQDDFGDFTARTFSQVKLRTQQVLRYCLRSRCVFIFKNSKRKTISQTLSDCLQEEEQYEWTDQNLDDILKNYDLKSPKLARHIANREG
ncbi:hypothetical protein GcM3_044019 [Golovinomyces cichoracearum]|uniref:Uncharacterized protein n=1 Tax=Golovinomyces cichoracearum TaxID=62708 RepID=A0A420J1E8_9PEZI|nr:hypothetical protein GcM3_044019 [Golovinomyces cichoracearum]